MLATKSLLKNNILLHPLFIHTSYGDSSVNDWSSKCNIPVKSCWSPFHSRHTLPIHYRNLKSHQSSFPHFPCHCCIEFVDFPPWPSDSIPTTAPINSIIVAPSHCDEPILDGIFLSDFFTVNSWTMDENGRECHHLAIVHSMLISFFFISDIPI